MTDDAPGTATLSLDKPLPAQFRMARMYSESKADGLEGTAVTGRVYVSKSGKRMCAKTMPALIS